MTRIDESIKRLETAYNTPMPKDPKKAYELDRERGQATLELAFAITQSVLRKILDPQGANADVKEYKFDERTKSIHTDDNGCRANIRKMIACLAHESNRIMNADSIQNGYSKGIQFDGENNIIGESYVSQTSKVIEAKDIDGETYSDGMELVGVACETLTTEIMKQIERDGEVKLDKPYEYSRIKKRVYVGYSDIDPAIETMERSPFEIARASVRVAIKNNASLKLETSPYLYISEFEEFEGEEVELYKRLPKALTYTLTDDRGGVGEYCTELLESIERANLTTRQSQVLNYKYQGIGIDTIGNKLGISKQRVSQHLKNIREKLGGEKHYLEMVRRDRDKTVKKAIFDLRDRQNRTKVLTDLLTKEREERDRERVKSVVSESSIKARSEREYCEKMRLMNERIEREKRRYETPETIERETETERREKEELLDSLNVLAILERCERTAYMTVHNDFERRETERRETERRESERMEERRKQRERAFEESEKFERVMRRLKEGKNVQEVVNPERKETDEKTREERVKAFRERNREMVERLKRDRAILERDREREKARGAERERRQRERTRERREREREEKLLKELGIELDA